MKKCFFTIVADKTSDDLKRQEDSVNKFYNDIDFVTFETKDINFTGDKMIEKRSIPPILNVLFNKGYEFLIKLPEGAVMTKPISDIMCEEFDMTVFPMKTAEEIKKEPYSVWFIDPAEYFDTSFFMIKNKEMAAQWMNLCYKPFFTNYKNGQRDILNILIHFGNYKVKMFPKEEISKYFV